MTSLNRILYVEDDRNIQEVAQIALEDIGGIDVCACSSGAEALEKAKDYSPQLILLDAVMPGMDGPTTCKALKELPSLCDVPVVFMTAKVQPKDIEYFKSIGAVEVIEKPFDPMTLASQIEDVWLKIGASI